MYEQQQVVIATLGKDEHGNEIKLAVAAEPVGDSLVADRGEIVGQLGMVTEAIERVGRDVMESVKKIAPKRACVELAFGVAVESGGVIALFGKGKGEATITVTLEWGDDAANGQATR